MELTRYKLGCLIQQRKEKYNGFENLSAWGVSRGGFIPPKQDGADTSIYNVFYKNDFVFNPARMELNSIALNIDYEKAICSSLYEIFYVTRTDIILPEYLNIFIKRDEFARKCWFEAIGSARNYFRVSNIAEFAIDLPSIDIQQKYVDIYMGLKKNIEAYESGLDDLKLLCDAYIENLRRTTPIEKIQQYIIRTDEKNSDNKIKNVKGVSVYKQFREPTSKVDKKSLTNYKIVHPEEISFVQTTHNEKVFAYALNNTNEDIVVSSVNEVFKTDKKFLLPEYLAMFFNRTEFDRYARYNSWGSARETFTWEDLCEVKIPIPKIEIQQSIVNIYNAYNERKSIVEKLKDIQKNICPILIKGSIEEARKGDKYVSTAV